MSFNYLSPFLFRPFFSPAAYVQDRLDELINGRRAKMNHIWIIGHHDLLTLLNQMVIHLQFTVLLYCCSLCFRFDKAEQSTNRNNFVVWLNYACAILEQKWLEISLVCQCFSCGIYISTQYIGRNIDRYLYLCSFGTWTSACIHSEIRLVLFILFLPFSSVHEHCDLQAHQAL